MAILNKGIGSFSWHFLSMFFYKIPVNKCSLAVNEKIMLPTSFMTF